MYAGMPVSAVSPSRSPAPATNQPRPAERDDRGDHGQADGRPCAARSTPRRSRGRTSACAADEGGDHEGALQQDQHEAETRPGRWSRRRRGRPGQQDRGRDGRDQRDDPADQHRDPGGAGQQGEHGQHRQHGAEPPRGAEVAEATGRPGRGRRAAAPGPARRRAAAPRRRRAARAGTHHGESSSGTTATRGGRRRPRPSGRAHAPRHDRERGGHHDQAEQQRRSTQATGVNAGDEGEQQARAPGGTPAAVRRRGRRSRARRGRARAAGRPTTTVAEPAVAPGAAGDRDQRVGRRAPQQQPARRAGGADEPARRPAGSATRPRARAGTASRKTALTAAVGLPPSSEASSASGSTYAGAGTARALAERVPGLGPEPPPVPGRLRAPGRARRRRRSRTPRGRRRARARTTTAEHDSATGLVRNRATSPVSSPRAVLVGAGRGRPGARPGRGLGGGLRRVGARPRPEAWLVSRGERRRRGSPARAGRAARPGASSRSTAAGSPGWRGSAGRGGRRRISRGLRVERDQGGELVERLADRADQQEADHPQEGAEPEPDQLEGQRAAPGSWPAACRARRGAPGSACAARSAACAGAPRWAASAWKTTACGTTTVRWPAVAARQPKSMSLPKIGSCGVEAAELLEHPAAHQHAGGVDREHGADLVVLALVVLAALQTGLAPAGAGDRDAELEQALAARATRAAWGRGRRRRGRPRRRPAAPRARPGSGFASSCRIQTHSGASPVGGELLETERDGGGEGGRSGGPQHLAEGVARAGRGCRPCCRCRRATTRSTGVRCAAESLDDGGEPALPVVADQQRGDR